MLGRGLGACWPDCTPWACWPDCTPCAAPQDHTPQGTGGSLTALPTMPGTGTAGSAGSEFESQLFKHGRLRRLGPLEEEQARP